MRTSKAGHEERKCRVWGWAAQQDCSSDASATRYAGVRWTCATALRVTCIMYRFIKRAGGVPIKSWAKIWTCWTCFKSMTLRKDCRLRMSKHFISSMNCECIFLNAILIHSEADILTNWSLNEEWRADVWYAALMSKVIVDHYKEIILKRNISIEVLSNDNAFMNYSPYYFTQRTLLARYPNLI